MYNSTSASEGSDINNDNFPYSKPTSSKWEEKFIFLRNKWSNEFKRAQMNYSNVEKYESTYKNSYEYEHPRLQKMQHFYAFQEIHRSNKQPHRIYIPYKDFKYCKQHSSCPKTEQRKNYNPYGCYHNNNNSSNRKYCNYSESSSDELITSRRNRYKNYKQLQRYSPDKNVHKNRNNVHKNQRKNCDIKRMHKGRSSAGSSKGFTSKTHLIDSIALQKLKNEEKEETEITPNDRTGSIPHRWSSIDRGNSKGGAPNEREYERETSVYYDARDSMHSTQFERKYSAYNDELRNSTNAAPHKREYSKYEDPSNSIYRASVDKENSFYNFDNELEYIKRDSINGAQNMQRNFNSDAKNKRRTKSSRGSAQSEQRGQSQKSSHSKNNNLKEDKSFITFEHVCSCLKKLQKKYQGSVDCSHLKDSKFERTPCSDPECMKRECCPSDCLKSYITFENGYIENGYVENTNRYDENGDKLNDYRDQINEHSRSESVQNNGSISLPQYSVQRNGYIQKMSEYMPIGASINSDNKQKSSNITYSSIQKNDKQNYSSDFNRDSIDNRPKSRKVSYSQPVQRNEYEENYSSNSVNRDSTDNYNSPKSRKVSYSQPVQQNEYEQNYSPEQNEYEYEPHFSSHFIRDSMDSYNIRKTKNMSRSKSPVYKNRQKQNHEYNSTSYDNRNACYYQVPNNEYSSLSNESTTYLPIKISASDLRNVKCFQSKNSIKCIRAHNTPSKPNYEPKPPCNYQRKKKTTRKEKPKPCYCHCKREIKQKICKCVFIEDSESSSDQNCCCTKKEKPKCCCCKYKQQQKRKICKCQCKNSDTSTSSLSESYTYLKCPYTQKKCKCASSNERETRILENQTCICSESESYSEDSLAEQSSDDEPEPESSYSQINEKSSEINMRSQVTSTTSTSKCVLNRLRESFSNLSNKICRPLKRIECPSPCCEEKIKRIPSKAKEIIRKFKDLIKPPKPNNISKPICIPASKISQVQINSLDPKNTIGGTVIAQDLISYLSDDAPKDCSCAERCCSKLNCPYWKDSEPQTHETISFPHSNETSNRNKPIFTISKTSATTKPRRSKLRSNIEPIIEEENENDDTKYDKSEQVYRPMNTPRICQIKSCPKSKTICCKSVHFCTPSSIQCIPPKDYFKPSCAALNTKKEPKVCTSKTCGTYSSLLTQWKEYLCPKKSAVQITPKRRWLKEMIETIPPKMYGDVPDIQFKFVPPLCKKKYHVVKMKKLCSF